MRTTLLTLLLFTCFWTIAQEKRVMSLEECVELAVENNLNIQRSKLNLETAETDLMQARMSRFPDLNLSSNYSVAWGRSIDPVSNQFINQRINSFRPNANTGVTLFNWFNITNNIKSNEEEVKASEYDVDRSHNDVQLDVISFYLNVLFNKELLENAKFQLESSKEQLERTKKLVASGALPRSNELELASQVATNEVNLVNAQNDLRVALLNLKQVMLVPASENIDIEIPDADIAEPDLSVQVEDVYGDAQNTMPEIKAADFRVQSAEYNYLAAKGARYPSISLNAGAGSNFSSAAKPFDPTLDGSEFTFIEQIRENFNQFIALSLNIPIFNGLSAQANVQRSKIGMQQAQINAQEQRNILRQTIETVYNDAVAASKSYEAAQSQVDALEETFRTVKNQLSAGAANATDFQVAQNNLFQAKSDLARAKFDYIFRKKLLDFYQGKSIF